MALPELELTPDGWELQFATNHLGHFALALGLHDALAAVGDARIVSLSSRGHLRSPVVFDDINFSSRPYDPWLAYGQSKTANVLFAVGATDHWAADGITANAVHPGGIMETNLARYMDPEQVAQLRAAAATTGATTQTINGAPIRFKTIAQGAATSVLVATSPQLEGIGGRYFEDCNEAETAGARDTSAPPPPASPRTRSTQTPPSVCGRCRWPRCGLSTRPRAEALAVGAGGASPRQSSDPTCWAFISCARQRAGWVHWQPGQVPTCRVWPDGLVPGPEDDPSSVLSIPPGETGIGRLPGRLRAVIRARATGRVPGRFGS